MPAMRVVGVQLYSSDIGRSRDFYENVLALNTTTTHASHHFTSTTGDTFLAVKIAGAAKDSSHDKAVVFVEVDDLPAAIDTIGPDRFVQCEAGAAWAVLHDPDGHNVLLFQKHQHS